MRFVALDGEKEIVKPISYQSFPEDLYREGVWGHFAFIEDSEIKIRVICSAYNSDRYSPGTVVVSNKVFNEFPIAQCSWSMDNNINRMYVDPFYRSKKIATYSVITNDMLAQKLGHEIWSEIYSSTNAGGTVAGDQLYNKIYSLGFEEKKVNIDLNDIYSYRNFTYPVNYIDKRIVYDETAI